jgi:hypothetical protein
MFRSLWLFCSLISVSFLFISCGDDDGVGPGVGDEGYFPNRDGSTWTYEFNDDVSTLSTWNETRTVNGMRDVDGVTCQIMEITYSNDESEMDRIFIKDDEESRVDVWGMERLIDGTVDETYYFDAPVLLFKYPCYVGASWDVYSTKGLKPTDVPFAGFEDDDLDDDGVDDLADVIVDADVIAREDVNVRAGAFDGCFKVSYTLDIIVYFSYWGEWLIDATSYQWFKPYVGFVQTYTFVDLPTPLPDEEVVEELIFYTLPP